VGSDGAPAGRAGDDYENENENLSGGGRGSGSLGHVPPNHPARPAVSGATPAREFSGMRGGLSAGPANGSMDVMGGGGGGQSFGNAPQPLAQTLSASVGVLSMQKNKNEGDPTLAQYGEVALGGDESEEDGEEIGSRNPVANAEKDASGDADEDMEDDDA
jgi:predicted lipid-binding transport protein (Tim44 family)